MPQETHLDNFQVKVPSVCQTVCQVPSQLNSKEVTHLKCQRNRQVPIQGPHQLICQIESSRDTRLFTIKMSIIIPSSTGFRESNWDPSESFSNNPTKYPSPVPIIKPSSGPSKTPTKYPSHVSK